MGRVKDIYFQAFEQLTSELERDPTDAEVEERVAAMLGDAIERSHETGKECKLIMRYKI